MDAHSFSFWIGIGFLAGILFVSFGIFSIIPLFLTCGAVFWKLESCRRLIKIFLGGTVLGAAYFQIFFFVQTAVIAPLGSSVVFEGVAIKVDRSLSSQTLILQLQKPNSGKVLVRSRNYPSFEYGDLVRVSGNLKPIPENRKDYFLKEGISGISEFPKIEFLAGEKGNFVKARLLNFKEKIIATFYRVLPPEKAALLSGINLGYRGGFSKDFEDRMALSGTTHLVALSGYNISVIALAVSVVLGHLVSRRLSFFLSVAVIVIFVIMTGAEVSAVRAAIMGIIVLLAEQSQKVFSVRNAIIFAAFLMLLFNPRLLVFDLGFQLSFAALVGIIYLEPILRRKFNILDDGWLEWKKNGLLTVSAQIFVLPLLLGNFGQFPLASVASNILIAIAIPLTMFLGFVTAGLGFLSAAFAGIIGLLANLFLSYEIFLIDFFSRLPLLIEISGFGIGFGMIYYFFLGFFIYKNRHLVYAD